ncbi:bifunctional DNA-formamidopyrimidine glycosylase/DNA-(apurinic or apyrimidinic site) lyase [Roseinatronobacter alkalisoli]|uniref:Formamidopyrimidine-DNA glycosylase n=1 Tax=Roseinatronobacter alkalisoli TaxID=3028235 RepID=A0ABT5TAE4_9RHOB|nr:bifunctional DNA-formamidopyrimidine glycosylase/DNA-(apurinic or apyrimidinic site) lyase [Roseinatronobacter sp. HJB301]MDD7972072.1 bifunctional DNA-formamidopyrimidine glycosylase/DNA-(apurinic or apyrimidinic site) lyase [Roseinatronobacter sp. HJB301]
MPELPEVETVRRGLLPAMEGRHISRAEIRRDGLRWPFPPDMGARLDGAHVLGLRRRSKYLLVDLAHGDTLIIHLGMSGRMVVSGLRAAHVPGQFHFDHPPVEKHDHVIFHMDNGARVTFNDPRRFGAMDLCATATLDGHKLLSGLGPEPLGNDFSAPYLAARLKGRKMPVKAALLDQRIIAGLGNIYVCEALFRAGISPLRPAGQISVARIESLTTAIRETLTDAIAAGGSSLRDYRQADGELGYFQHAFQVYGRENAPCMTPDCKGNIRRIVQSGRSSFYCAQCQR